MSSFGIMRSGLRLANRALNPFGVLISRPEVIHGSPRFSGATLLSRRIFQLRRFFEAIKDVEGDVIESGTQWGYGLLAHLHLIADGPPRKVYAFDSFLGHSKAMEQDRSGGKFVELGDSFRISQDDVWKTLQLGTTYSDGELRTKVELVPGWIQDTMPKFRARAEQEDIRIALVHCDVDLYEPFKATLTNVWPVVSVGGIILLGGMNNPELMGKTIAVREFLATLKTEKYALQEVELRDHGYQPQAFSYLRKRG